MRAVDFITELFEPNHHATIEWGNKTPSGTVKATAMIGKDREVEVWFEYIGKEVVEVSFTVDGTFELSNGGDQYKVFSTVIDIIKDFDYAYGPKYLTFSAKENSRRSLYKKMAARLASSTGYQVGTVKDLPPESLKYVSSGNFVLVNDSSIDEAVLDPSGWGQTPYGTDIDYFGLRVQMRPSTFLKLSHPLGSSETNPDVEKHMQSGGKIAYPFLQIKDPIEWEEGDFSQLGKVVSHEGRNRMTQWIKMKGDEPIQVNILLRGANRRQYITDEMIDAMSKGLISQTGEVIRNPFASNSALEEGNEMVDEAINMTHLDEPMKTAVEAGIKTAIGNLYDAKGGYPKLEDRFDSGEGTTAFLNQMVAMLFSDFEKWNVVEIVTKSVVAGLTKELGKNVVKKFKFMDTGDAYGQAGTSSIDINENLIKAVARKAVDNLVEATLSSYGEGELVGGFWYMINSIKRGEKDYVHVIFERNEERINLIASTIVHEVVHVLQHKRQKDVKRPGTEYRSYLDKKNGEFVGLHNRRGSKAAKNKLSPEEEGRYFDLYYASPQEIASFSNEIAIKIIRDFGIDGARSIEDLNNAASAVDAESVIDYVREHLKDRFKAPENKREYAVFKRYVKLTYAALQSWLDKQRERFKD